MTSEVIFGILNEKGECRNTQNRILRFLAEVTMDNRFVMKRGNFMWIVMIAALLICFVCYIVFVAHPIRPIPEIQYGEFPFTLTYEIDGERKVIKDTIICEYDGYKMLGEAGWYREWNSHLKSGNDRITLLDLKSRNEKNEFDYWMLELFFYWGNAEYYMGEPLDYASRDPKNEQDFDWIDYQYQTPDGIVGYSAYAAEEAFRKYGIKLISWECSLPIENTLK